MPGFHPLLGIGLSRISVRGSPSKLLHSVLIGLVFYALIHPFHSSYMSNSIGQLDSYLHGSMSRSICLKGLYFPRHSEISATLGTELMDPASPPDRHTDTATRRQGDTFSALINLYLISIFSNLINFPRLHRNGSTISDDHRKRNQWLLSLLQGAPRARIKRIQSERANGGFSRTSHFH